ncbi:MAG: 50S ribosome-binding GTPase, partial [Gammaproteobacteria bacterium]|nr:50S ribosome-binding GTPase [Gammaproteobacteria bacterium]
MNDTPRFAVVGHPNKGKSSIVATLSSDTSVAIAPLSGTTTHCREYPLRVDGELLYVLIDTPGFQRARKALAWMQEHAGDAAGRPDLVRSFVAQFAGRGEFPDECELLRPVIEGAGIIYVTDGSRPYGREYEAEMEI